MNPLLRVLIVEDSEDDALLLERELRRDGYDLRIERVDHAEAMAAALRRGPWDVILSDFSLPHFGGLEALKLLQQSGLDIPFLLVSGAIGEETAVEVMRAGAHDFVMKDDLSRLAPAVRRELAEAQIRRERREAEDMLRSAREELEGRVRERTAELTRANERLREEAAERERAQEKLHRAEKAAAAGMVMAGVAHEINNPLHVIYGNLRLLHELLGSGAIEPSALRRGRKMLADALASAEAARRVVEEFRRFATESQEPVRTDLRDLLDRAIREVKPLCGGRVRIRRRFEAAAAVLRPAQMHRAIVNLLRNAVEAMPGGGTIYVSLAREKGQAIVEVRDTGPGIPAEILPRIFDPFFTTKKGFGLGLALCAAVVQTHGGEIAVDSPPGGGAKFTLRVPLAESGEVRRRRTTSPAAPA